MPSVGIKLRHNLRKCADICLAEALIVQNNTRIDRYSNFICLFEMEWSDNVSSNALEPLDLRKWIKPKHCPLADDIKNLK